MKTAACRERFARVRLSKPGPRDVVGEQALLFEMRDRRAEQAGLLTGRIGAQLEERWPCVMRPPPSESDTQLLAGRIGAQLEERWPKVENSAFTWRERVAQRLELDTPNLTREWRVC